MYAESALNSPSELFGRYNLYEKNRGSREIGRLQLAGLTMVFLVQILNHAYRTVCILQYYGLNRVKPAEWIISG